jgi:glycosyltransferase involved in cell wall biosynthesis
MFFDQGPKFMKLVFTSYNGSPEYSDPETWLKRINGWTGILEQLAINNTVTDIEQINYEGEYRQNGVHYYFTRAKKRKIRFPWRMHRFIKRLQPDIVFVNGFIFPLQIIQLKWKLGKAVKIIVINHAEKPFTGFRKFFQRQADKYVHRYFFTAKEMGVEWILRGIISDESKITEVMEASSVFYAMEKEKARARTGVVNGIPFLWVGRLDANKDPLTVIKAFGNFIKHQPSAKLYMIYHTNDLYDEIVNYCDKSTDLKKAVTLVGKVLHDEMQYWYNSADFIVSGSRYEGSGVAVCEAMSCGCIPVLTDIQSFRKMTGPFKCGFLYEPGNEKDLLGILLKTKELNIEEERTRVLRQFKDELSFEAIACKINHVIVSS